MEPIDLLRDRAGLGEAEAQYQLALCYDNADGVPRDPVAAANWYRFAAEQSHAQAQFHLGLMLNLGDVGFERDDAAAVDWFRKAAEQGLADAQFNLGLMYYNGEGLAHDDAEAFRWFSAATEQGHAKAQFNLGVLYANGHGVDADNIECYRLWLMASTQGEPNAHANLAMMRDKLTAAEAEAAQSAAVAWANHPPPTATQ